MRLVAISALFVASTGCDALFGLTRVAGTDDGHVEDASSDADHRSTDAAIDAPVDAPRTPGCPANYIQIGTLANRYRTATPIVDWPTAEQLCEADRGNFALYTHLVVFATDNERSMVNALVSGSVRWIGLSDRIVDQTYRWVSTENPVYPPLTAWTSNGPDTTPGADCGEMLGNSDLQMTGCMPQPVGLTFICECDAFPVDKTHF